MRSCQRKYLRIMTSQTPNFERNEMETRDREIKSSANRGYIVNSMEGSQVLARNSVAFEVGSPRCGQAGSYMQSDFPIPISQSLGYHMRHRNKFHRKDLAMRYSRYDSATATPDSATPSPDRSQTLDFKEERK